MSETCSKACNGAAAPTLLFSCSGGSDVGELADQATRALAKEGAGKMYCLAGVGGRVSGILATTESAGTILAIDGCPLDCAKKSLEGAGFSNFSHLQLNDLGFKKGQSAANEETIGAVLAQARALLKTER